MLDRQGHDEARSMNYFGDRVRRLQAVERIPRPNQYLVWDDHGSVLDWASRISAWLVAGWDLVPLGWREHQPFSLASSGAAQSRLAGASSMYSSDACKTVVMPSFPNA